MAARFPVHGKGLGLRRPHLEELAAAWPAAIDFMELAPENWAGLGGRSRRSLAAVAERVPLVAHGLGTNLGGQAPLDTAWLARLKSFLADYRIRCFSDHLSYCADEGQLYELLPMPFTAGAVQHVAARIRQVQDVLGQRIAIENISYYCAPGAEMSELEFIDAVIAEADCDLLIDVNNIYVNSVNHGYDALEYLCGLPAERITYAHIAGHHVRAPDLLIDTHGAPIVDPVWALLDEAYARLGVFPTLLERDFNLPPLAELLDEVERIGAAQAAGTRRDAKRRA
jgi:hypothetical protein